MQKPEWARDLGNGAVGLVRSNVLKYLLYGGAVLFLAIGILMPVTSWNRKGASQSGMLILGAVFVIAALVLAWFAGRSTKNPVMKVDDVGIHRLFGSYVLLPWADISEIAPGMRGQLVITTPNGRTNKDGSKTKTKTFYLKLGSFEGGRYLPAYLVERWRAAGGYRPTGD